MRSWLRLFLVVLAVAMGGPRRAAAETDPAPSGAVPPQKSPGLALGLSIALPLAGYGLYVGSAMSGRSDQGLPYVGLWLGAGLALIGPSGGHFYAGQVGRGLAFSGARLLLLALAASAFVDGVDHSDVSESGYDPGAANSSMIEFLLCGAGILGLTIWESIDSYFSVEALNRAPKRSLAISPMIVRNGERGFSLAGLSLAATY